MVRPPSSTSSAATRIAIHDGGYSRSASVMTLRMYGSAGRSAETGVRPSSALSTSACTCCSTSGSVPIRWKTKARVEAVVSLPATRKVTTWSRTWASSSFSPVSGCSARSRVDSRSPWLASDRRRSAIMSATICRSRVLAWS
ncbi:hypothetical protein SGRIM128S_01708 [Streptomyces griseomycini]